MPVDDERELTQLFFDMIQQEQYLENYKQQLVEQPDFNLMDGFQMIDSKSLGWVSAPQILTFLFEAGIYSHKDDIYNFARRYDRDHDSRLLYSDFCEAVTPQDGYYAHALNQRKHKYLHFTDIPKKDYFTERTREAFFNVFRAHFEIEEKIELSKKRLTRKPTFNIHDAFSTVDYYKNGKLTIDDLKRLMQRNGFHPTDTELALLSRRLDRNQNGFITYQEFMDEVLPRTSLLGDKCAMNLLKKADVFMEEKHYNEIRKKEEQQRQFMKGMARPQTIQ